MLISLILLAGACSVPTCPSAQELAEAVRVWREIEAQEKLNRDCLECLMTARVIRATRISRVHCRPPEEDETAATCRITLHYHDRGTLNAIVEVVKEDEAWSVRSGHAIFEK